MIDRLRKIGTWIKQRIIKVLIALGIVGIVGIAVASQFGGVSFPVVEVNGQVIEFLYTDDNAGEDLIIYTDKEMYGGWRGETISVYYYIENKSGLGENFDIQTYLDGSTLKSTHLLVEDIPKTRQVLVFDTVCEDIDYEATSSTLARTVNECSEVEVGKTSEDYTIDEWLLLSDFSQKEVKNLSRKSVRELTTNKRTKAFIAKNGYAVLRKEIVIDEVGTKEFFEEVFSLSAYGHLDPIITSAWAGYDTLNTNETLVASNETDITLIDNCINDSATFKSEGKADGTDTRYTTSTALGSAVLDHNLVYYNDGDCQIMIKVPSVSSTTPDTIYKWAGNAAASDISTSSAYGPEYDFFGHFEATSTDSSGDTFRPAVKTLNVTFGSGSGMPGQHYTVDADAEARVCWAGAPSTTNNESFTYSGWCYAYNASSKGGCFSIGSDGGTNGGGGMFWGGANGQAAGANVLGLRGGIAWEDTTYNFTEDTWEYWVQVRDADSTMYYVNGVLQTDIVAGDPVVDDTIMVIGNRSDNTTSCTTEANFNLYGAHARVDEVTITSDIRSPGQIMTEFNNVISSSTFWGNDGWTVVAVARRFMGVQ